MKITNMQNRGNYLISLYYKTENAYSLDRAKLENLLIIETLCFAKNRIDNTNQLLYRTDTKLVHLPDIIFSKYSFFPNSIVKGYELENGIINRIIDESIEAPEFYRVIYISLEEKKLLKQIFLKFGNTKLNDLRNNLSEIFYQMYNLFDAEEKINVDPNDVYNFFKKNNMKENEVFDFIDNIVISNKQSISSFKSQEDLSLTMNKKEELVKPSSFFNNNKTTLANRNIYKVKMKIYNNPKRKI